MRHIVYIVGAGLTKALEHTKRVPLMYDFVSVMADYLLDDDGRCDNVLLTTLAGLERDGVFECENPVLKELSRVFFSSRIEPVNERLTKNELVVFRDLMRTRPPESIETLLRRTHELNKKKDSLQWNFGPAQFSFAINQVFSHIGWELNITCLSEFLKRQLRVADTKHTFIDFNYDLVLDRCIQDQNAQQWRPSTGYGFTVDRFVSEEEASQHMKQYSGTGPKAISPLRARELINNSESELSVKILKPHGSLNWLVEFTDNYTFIESVPVLCLKSDKSMSYFPPFRCEDIQLRVDTSRSMKGTLSQTGLYLVPPTESKNRDIGFINAIREQEKEAYKSADEIYVIGWSMPQTDKYQVDIISECLRKRVKPLERLSVINKRAPKVYYDGVARVFGVDERNIDIHNAGFCKYANDFLT